MKWKRILNWGLGGLAVGTAAVLARRSRTRAKWAPETIPEDVQAIEVLTESRNSAYEGRRFTSRTFYRCTPTRFRLWSFLRDEDAEDETGSRGQVIYHVSPEVRLESPDSGVEVEVLPEEKFYATINVLVDRARDSLPGLIARGQLLEFRKCHVGGSINGIETGERIVTESRVDSFLFVCESRDDEELAEQPS